MKKIKILILSSPPWNNENSFGNTFSNLFKNIECEILNIYFKPGLPNNNLHNIKYFQITDKELFKSIINKKNQVGMIIKKNSINKSNDEVISYVQKKRWIIFYLIREVLWSIGSWKSKKLIDVINNFKPDLMYIPITYYCFMNKIALNLKNDINIPMIGHISDDFYSYKNNGLNIFANIYQFFIRKSIYKLIKQCEFVDCFAYNQKEEYEKFFNIPFKIRYKSANIENVEVKKENNNPLIFLYTGNLGNKRWENLVEIGKALDKINDNNVKAILNIYSGTPLTKEMENEFNNCQSLNFMGSVSGEEVQKLQSNADVLIHTESFDKREIQAVRMSLSTKIIDYLSKGKCILAFGPKEVASMDYFIQNDCGVVVDNYNDLFIKINELIENNELLYNYSNKALEIAQKNHNPEKLHNEFYNGLISILDKNHE